MSGRHAARAVSRLCSSISRSIDRQFSSCSGNLSVSSAWVLGGFVICHVAPAAFLNFFKLHLLVHP